MTYRASSLGARQALDKGTVEPEWSCTTCGAVMSSEDRFCTACGTPSKEGRQGNSTPARRRLPLIGIAALCLALAGGLALALRGSGAPSDLATTRGTYLGYLEDDEGKRFAFTVELPGSGQGQVGKVEVFAPSPSCIGTWRMYSARSGVWDFEQSLTGACWATYNVRATTAGGDKYDLSIPGDPRYHGEMELEEAQ